MSNQKGKKRSADSEQVAPLSKKEKDELGKSKKQDGGVEDLVFEDPFEDDIDEEDEDLAKQGGKQGDENDEEGDEDVGMQDEENEEKEEKKKRKVWRPEDGIDDKNEALDYDSRAYTALHRMKVDWPCLSFDIIQDNLGMFRTKFPQTMYMVAGTQAEQGQKDKVMILKASDLHKTKHDDDDDDDDDEDSDSDADDLDDDPILEEKFFIHPGAVNRIRCMPQKNNIIATWSDTGKVHIWDIKDRLASLDTPSQRIPKQTPVFTFSGHSTEGFAMDWSRLKEGRFVSGDCNKHIYLWETKQGGTFTVDSKPFTGHASSVEDLQWSPTEQDVFASCSSDKTIRIWDIRVRDKCQAWIAAHRTDVNVISWNRNKSAGHLLLSGADDGSIKVWDLRNFKSNAAAACFTYHKSAITSLEWHPSEESVLAAASEDNRVTIWDLGLEPDEEPAKGAELAEEIPPQLYFVHSGQEEIKEIHWHPQITSFMASTAADGFNFFKPSNME